MDLIVSAVVEIPYKTWTKRKQIGNEAHIDAVITRQWRDGRCCTTKICAERLGELIATAILEQRDAIFVSRDDVVTVSPNPGWLLGRG